MLSDTKCFLQDIGKLLPAFLIWISAIKHKSKATYITHKTKNCHISITQKSHDTDEHIQYNQALCRSTRVWVAINCTCEAKCITVPLIPQRRTRHLLIEQPLQQSLSSQLATHSHRLETASPSPKHKSLSKDGLYVNRAEQAICILTTTDPRHAARSSTLCSEHSKLFMKYSDYSGFNEIGVL